MKFTFLLQEVNQTKLVLSRRRIEVRRQIEEEEHMLRMLVEEEEVTVEDVKNNDSYFVQKRNAAGATGFLTHEEVTAVMRQLAYGYASDCVDEYLRMSESVASDAFKRFCLPVVSIYGEERRFPGMLGSVDCTHWTWKNCSTAWHCEFTGKQKQPTLILEIVASKNLWIWHALFGLPGSQNDINVLDTSPIFSWITEDTAHPTAFEVKGRQYDLGYYLANGIYPKYAMFIRTISAPITQKAQAQEAVRKDVERGFGVLKVRFAIIREAARLWKKVDLHYIMHACIILYNMIVEDERDTALVPEYDDTPPDFQMSELWRFFRPHQEIRDTQVNFGLQSDLMEHLWKKHGERSHF
ncbi:hypothetical protein G6F56_005204 [Rhizopus delemar]|nr:hypothetical protein G6F56_005204 [Rhizopus delemar]